MENELGNLSHKMIMQSLDWAYDKAVNGVKGLDSAEELAKDYLTQDGSLLDQINALIRWQNAKAGTSGFVTGLGGFLTIPITLPVNITSVLYLQLRMIAAIAIMCGYDVKNDKVKTLAYSCLVATSSVEIVKNLGIKIGEKVAVSALKKIPGTLFVKINQAVGFRLLTKFGEKGVLNIVKGIPLLVGIIGATFDILSTNTVGNIARDLFIGNTIDKHD